MGSLSAWVLAGGIPVERSALVEIPDRPSADHLWRNNRWELDGCWYLGADGPYSGSAQFDGKQFDPPIDPPPPNGRWDNDLRAWREAPPVVADTTPSEDWDKFAILIFDTNFDEWLRETMAQHPAINMDATYLISAIVGGRPNIGRLKMSWGAIMRTRFAPLEYRREWQEVVEICGIASISYILPHEVK